MTILAATVGITLKLELKSYPLDDLHSTRDNKSGPTCVMDLLGFDFKMVAPPNDPDNAVVVCVLRKSSIMKGILFNKRQSQREVTVVGRYTSLLSKLLCMYYIGGGFPDMGYSQII